MPLTIVRNDITKVKADAIVNSANPCPIYASGTDRAIYQAAGTEDLMQRAGYAFSPAIPLDRLAKNFIASGETNIWELNAVFAGTGTAGHEKYRILF